MVLPHIALLFAASSLSDLTLVRTINLQGDTYHVQGIDFDESRLWVTSVDKDNHKGFLQEFSLKAGDHLRTVDVTDGVRFHPGGMAASGESLWIPVAEYRRNSSAVIQRRNARTLKLEFQFGVPDHIGCVAVAPGFLIGANWDSRDFYVWSLNGKLIRKVPNPTPNGYQDLKFVDGVLVGAGLLPGRTGAIDWLEYPSLKLIRRIGAGQTSRGVPYTNEGMAIRGNRLFLLPEDSPSRLFEYRLPESTEPGYAVRNVERWRVLVEAGDSDLSPVLEELRAQLHAIARKVPAPALEKIRAVPIWIHRKSGTACMAFHPSAAWLSGHGFNPHMANAIEIGNATNFLEWSKQQPWMVLHELAHAYHFRNFGFNDPDILRVWQAAKAGGSYDSVLHISGESKKHYALTNQQEYFAELSESYFGTNDFYPFVRAELKKHDPAGYDMMQRLWGIKE